MGSLLAPVNRNSQLRNAQNNSPGRINEKIKWVGWFSPALEGGARVNSSFSHRNYYPKFVNRIYRYKFRPAELNAAKLRIKVHTC
jgi:hypothetical protein